MSLRPGSAAPGTCEKSQKESAPNPARQKRLTSAAGAALLPALEGGVSTRYVRNCCQRAATGESRPTKRAFLKVAGERPQRRVTHSARPADWTYVLLQRRGIFQHARPG